MWATLAEHARLFAIDLPGFGASERRDDLLSPRAMGGFLAQAHCRGRSGPASHRRAGRRDLGRPVRRGRASRADRERDRRRPAELRCRSSSVSRSGRGCSTPTSTSTAGWTRARSSTPRSTRSRAASPDDIRADYLACYDGDRFVESMRYVRRYPEELPVLAELLPQIATPVTIINGRHDRVVPLANAEFLDERLPNSRVVIIDAGHFVWEEAPAEYASAVLESINGAGREVTDVSFETLTITASEEGVLFAQIAAPPMNLLGPELVRDLVSLIQRAEADDAVPGGRVQERRPRLLHLPCRPDPSRRVPGGGGEADRRAVDRAAVSPSEREPPGHHRADRGSRTRRRQRVRSGLRHALRGARVGDLRSVRAGVRSDPRRRRRPAPHAADGSRTSARGDAERRGLRRRACGTVRLDQPRPARRRARGFRQLARPPDRRVPGGRPRRWSRTGSTRSRLRRPKTFVTTPICSARACALRTPKR